MATGKAGDAGCRVSARARVPSTAFQRGATVEHIRGSRRPWSPYPGAPQGPATITCTGFRSTDPWDKRVSIATAPLRLQEAPYRPLQGRGDSVLQSCTGREPAPSPRKAQGSSAAEPCQVRVTRRCRQQNWRRSVLAACRVRGPGVWSEPQQETLVPHSRRPPQGPPPSSCCWIRTTDPWDLRAGIATAPLRLQRPRERPRESLQQQALSGPPSGRAPMSPG